MIFIASDKWTDHALERFSHTEEKELFQIQLREKKHRRRHLGN